MTCKTVTVVSGDVQRAEPGAMVRGASSTVSVTTVGHVTPSLVAVTVNTAPMGLTVAVAKVCTYTQYSLVSLHVHY